MICRNCNYILGGNEQFCPHCGFSTSMSAQTDPDTTKPPSIFSAEKEIDDETKQTANKIFLSADDSNIYEEPIKKGKKTAVIIALSLLLLVLCTCAFFISRKLDIAPALSALLPGESTTQQAPTTTEALVSAVTGSLEESFGVIAPEILYKPVNCHIVSNTIIPIRKGPGDFYGQTTVIDAGQQVQIIGGDVAQKDWAYIFIPSIDCYGWIKGAYLTQSDSLDEITTLIQEQTAEDTSQSPNQ